MKISVAMTNFNNEKFITTAIKSILTQTYKNWELVFVDDDSIDNSLEIAAKARDIFDNFDIKVYKREKNGGYGPCLKDAIDKSTGEIIAIVDADDAVRQDALEIMVREHEKHPEAVVVYSKSYWCDKDLQPYKYGPSGPIPVGKTLLDCLINGPKTGRISHLKTFKKKFYDQLEYYEIENLRKRVDKVLMIQLEELGPIHFITDVLYYYRDHPLNLTNQYFRWDTVSKEHVDQQWKAIKEKASERRKKGDKK